MTAPAAKAPAVGDWCRDTDTNYSGRWVEHADGFRGLDVPGLAFLACRPDQVVVLRRRPRPDGGETR
jgi:hypothetical protein